MYARQNIKYLTCNIFLNTDQNTNRWVFLNPNLLKKRKVSFFKLQNLEPIYVLPFYKNSVFYIDQSCPEFEIIQVHRKKKKKLPLPESTVAHQKFQSHFSGCLKVSGPGCHRRLYLPDSHWALVIHKKTTYTIKIRWKQTDKEVHKGVIISGGKQRNPE